MAHRLLRDPEQDGWERSDMPIVCETCLGPNPFVRMQRIEYGGLCHISNRPYTVFRWKPGPEARYKKTIICQEVAKAKNVCQVCLLDLDYNLPVQVRDTALGMTNDDEPQSDVGKEFQLHQKVKEGENGSAFVESRPNDMLLRLQRTTPYYKRNMAKVCSFFAKGQCSRGAECPYRHEMPTTGELADQNIKDRYYGINDPVANKMMRRAGDLPKLETPEDTSIMTLFLGGVTPEMSEDDIRDHFYAFGEITSIKRVEAKACAFITYTTRAAAEKAATELYGKLIIKGQRLRLSWGKPQQERQGRSAEDPMQPSGSGYMRMAAPGQQADPAAQGAIAGPSGYGSAAPGQGAGDFFNLYPSMAKDNFGTRIPAPGDAAHKRTADAAPEVGDEASKRQRQSGQPGPPPSMGPPPARPPPHMPYIPPGAAPPPFLPPARPPPPYAPLPGMAPPFRPPAPGAPPPGYPMAFPAPGAGAGVRPPVPGGPPPPRPPA